MCDSQFQNLAIFLRIAKILPTFKRAKVLPWRLPNFGKGNNFVFLTIKKTKLFPLPKFALAGEIVISSWARHFTLTVPLSLISFVFNLYISAIALDRNSSFEKDQDILVLPLDSVKFDTHEQLTQDVLKHFGKVQFLSLDYYKGRG